MLVLGIFTTPKAVITFYEVTEKSYYRIDFVRDGTSFNVEPDGVIYSLIRDKNTYTIGDDFWYLEYQKFRSNVDHAAVKTSKSSKWYNGKFMSYVDSINDKLGCEIHTVLSNNQLSESTLRYGDCSCTLTALDINYDMKIRPINFSQYTKQVLDKNTVTQEVKSVFYSLDYLKSKYDLDYIESGEYDFCVATDVDTARARLKEFMDNPWPFRCIDTETTGLDICLYGEDKMVGIILGSDTRTATYFPFRHEGDFNLPMDFLREIMHCVKLKEDCLVAHNKKFDREVLLDEGYDIHIKWCSMQLSIILNPTIGKGIHGLKENTTELFHQHVLELKEIFTDPRNISFQKLTPELIKYYACPDGVNPLKLLEVWLKELSSTYQPLWQLECDLSDVKADQEYYGIRVDVKRYEHQYQNCNYILDLLLTAFRKLTKEDGNINSSQILGNLIYNKMHCPVLLRTKTGQPSVSTAAIKKLAGKKADKALNITEDLVDMDGKIIIKADKLATSKYPALVILTEYKKYIKLKTAFYARFERTMKTGRVFFWINQNGAATGRQSSPMHQLPPELKDCILADTEEHVFWGPDYSQIELRMIAYAAGETELIEKASDPENDIHRIIGSLISGKDMWEITPEERSKGKRRNFGVVYLISAFGLAGQLHGPGYTKEDVKACKKLLNEFFRRFKRIDRYIKQNGIDVKKNGYTSTLWYKRKRLFPQVFDPHLDPQTLASIIRMANNVPIQGTAADYMKCAENLYNAYIYEHGWNKKVDGFPMVRIMLSCHDEVLISAHNSIPYEEIVKMITTCMEIPIEGAPPFFAQPARLENWGGHSDDSLAMPIPYRNNLIKMYDETGKSIFHLSHFNLELSDEAKTDINTSGLSQPDLLDKWLPSARLVYEKGDYIKEARSMDVKDALRSYIVSGTTHYHVDDYREHLNDYRAEKLHTYMIDLVQKYGTDYKIVGDNVRHPSLTFQLLDLFDKEIPKDMEHKERIIEAARLYIEQLLNTTDKVVISKPVEKKQTIADKDLFMNQLELTVNLDRDGNVVFEDTEDEDAADVYGELYDEEDAQDINERIESKPIYAWTIGDVIAVDVQQLDESKINKVLSYLWRYRADNGFYHAFLLYKGKMVDTTIRIEDFNEEELNLLVTQLMEGVKAW